jgi:hypothetical protein
MVSFFPEIPAAGGFGCILLLENKQGSRTNKTTKPERNTITGSAELKGLHSFSPETDFQLPMSFTYCRRRFGYQKILPCV